MERELIIERAHAKLKIARKLRRVGGRKRQMTNRKIESAKKLLPNGVPPRDVAHSFWHIRIYPLPVDSRLIRSSTHFGIHFLWQLLLLDSSMDHHKLIRR